MKLDSPMPHFSNPFVAVLVFGLIVFGTTAIRAQSERTWSDSTGKFKIEAKLVKADADSVTLERSDGTTVTVPKARLSQVDLDFLANLDKKSDAEPMSADKLLDQIKVSASAVWEKDKFGGEPKLEVQIIARGAPASNATHIGMFDLKKFTNQDNEAIEQDEDEFSFHDITKEMEKVERRDDDMFAKHPKNALQLVLTVDYEKSIPKQVSELAGSFKIKTGGKKTEIEIANIASFNGKSVENKQADEFGIEVTVEINDDKNSQGGKYLTVKMGGQVSDILDVKVVDAKGKKPKHQTGWSYSGTIHGFYFDKKVGNDVTLVVTVVTDQTELEVPFEFTSIRVPKKK